MSRVSLIVLVWLASIAASGVPVAVATPQSAQARDLPAAGQDVERELATGAADEWRITLAAAELLVVTVEPLTQAETDEWPAVAVTGPDGGVLFDTIEPTVMTGIESSARTLVSVITNRAGPHRLRIAARISPVRYRLRLEIRRAAVADDQQRLAAHRLWGEAMHAYNDGAAPSLRQSTVKLDEALKILEAIADDEGSATTLANSSAVWYRLSDATRGTAATTRALEIWTRLDRPREAAMAQSDLGLLAYLAYDHPSARTYYDTALAGHRAVGDVASEARTLTRMGWVFYAAADLQQVIETSQQALVLWRSVGDPAGESITLNDLGRAYLDLGDISPALDALRQALTLRPADRYPRGAANILIRTGLVYLAVAEWQQALDVLQQARALAHQVHDPRTEITTLVNLGSAFVTFADTGEGARYLQAGLTRAREIDFRGAEAYALLWLGIGASLDGDWAQSRDYLQQAIAIQTAIKDVRGQATTTRQLATAQLALGAPQDALASVTRSIEISPPASGLIYTGALTLANVYAALGDGAKAQAQYEEALGRFRQVRARHAESLALTSYARFHARQGRYAEARTLLAQGLDIHESLRGLLVDPDLRMSYGSASLAPYRLYVDVLMDLERQSPGRGFAEEAFHTNERARARGLLELLARSGIDAHAGVDAALVERERSLRWNLNRKAAVQTTLLAGKRDEARVAALEQEIASLSRAWRETTTTIRQQSPAYASLTSPEPATVADVRALLDSRTVLLAYAPGETRTWLFAVTSSGFDAFPLASSTTIESTSRDVHRLLTARQPVRGETVTARQARVGRADTDLTVRSRGLSDLVLGPIRDKLATEWRGHRLAIVATGALEYVPFAVLPVPGAGGQGERPLVSAHEIVTLPSASTLAFLRKAPRTPARKTIAVFADPVFARDDPRVTAGAPATGEATRGAARDAAVPDALTDPPLTTRAFEPFLADGGRASLERLPFSRAEAVAVASQVPRSSLLAATDFDATLALATSRRLADYRIVHFATHGLINTSRPELSGLALSLVDRTGRARDGFLRLNTIYDLRLSADLVVLSACQTALGKEVAGEGLVGLTRGFMHAGARRVIASLWQVSDAATAELMRKFYVGLLQQRLPAAAALRAAQREMARDPRWSAPYYWAGFVLQGDWQP